MGGDGEARKMWECDPPRLKPQRLCLAVSNFGELEMAAKKKRAKKPARKVKASEQGKAGPVRNAKGQINPGHSGNPGGRPKSMRRRILDKLGEEGMERFTDKLIQTIENYEAGEALPERAAWFLQREYPAVTKVEANVSDGRREEIPEVPDTEARRKEVAEILWGEDSDERLGDRSKMH